MNRSTSSGVNRPIPEVNCYDCMDKSLIEVRRDYYDLLVSLPKYMQQIRSFFSTRLTKLQCWEETIPVWITYKRVVYTLARHKCLGYSNYRSKAIPFSRPLSLMSTELTESISSHPARCAQRWFILVQSSLQQLYAKSNIYSFDSYHTDVSFWTGFWGKKRIASKEQILKPITPSKGCRW